MNIGQKLKMYREEKNVTLEQLSEATCISVNYLKCMEENKFDRISTHDVYIKGFLKNYCNYIGIASDEILKAYSGGSFNEVNSENKEQHSINIKKNSGWLGPYFWIAFNTTILVFAVFVGLNYHYGEKVFTLKPAKISKEKVEKIKKREKEIEKFLEKKAFPEDFKVKVGIKKAETETEADFLKEDLEENKVKDDIQLWLTESKDLEPILSISKYEEFKPEKQKNPIKSEQKIFLKCEFTKACWLKVVIDGISKGGRLAKEGEFVEFRGNEKIHMRFGNSTGVKLYYNGQVIDMLDYVKKRKKTTLNVDIFVDKFIVK